MYIETSVVSYLTARPSRDLIVAAHQQLTHEWWDERRAEFDVVISRVVLEEAALGEPDMARRRLDALEGMPLLPVKPEASALAAALVRRGGLPAKASTDALHIAVASVSGVDYLLTWNCKHIANAQTRRAVSAACRAAGYEPPVICTPEELMGEGGADVD